MWIQRAAAIAGKASRAVMVVDQAGQRRRRILNPEALKTAQRSRYPGASVI